MYTFSDNRYPQGFVLKEHFFLQVEILKHNLLQKKKFKVLQYVVRVVRLNFLRISKKLFS